MYIRCPFGKDYFCQLILLFSLFLLLFIGLIALFYNIYEYRCIISANFYLYLQYFQQKVFSFSKINESQTDPRCVIKILRLLLLKNIFGNKKKKNYLPNVNHNRSLRSNYS